MAKYFGKIGYALTTETSPSVWTEEIVEKEYYGDVLQHTRRYQNSGYVNDNVTINNRISIVADPFAYSNLGFIRYLTWMGTKWKVDSVDVEYPRLILSLGGVYNAEDET